MSVFYQVKVLLLLYGKDLLNMFYLPWLKLEDGVDLLELIKLLVAFMVRPSVSNYTELMPACGLVLEGCKIILEFLMRLRCFANTVSRFQKWWEAAFCWWWRGSAEEVWCVAVKTHFGVTSKRPPHCELIHHLPERYKVYCRITSVAQLWVTKCTRPPSKVTHSSSEDVERKCNGNRRWFTWLVCSKG